MNSKYVLGCSIIVLLMLFAGINLEKYATPYVSLSEAMSVDRTVQVKGNQVPGSAVYNQETELFEFEMSDESGRIFLVKYDEPKPSNFDRAKEIVAIGVYADNAFWADRLLIKCPSKYEAEPVVVASIDQPMN